MNLIVRFWKNWRRKARLLASQHWKTSDGFIARELLYPELHQQALSGEPQLQPYEDLAEFWHEYSSLRQPDYAPFLASLASQFGLKIKCVLDLACGTGALAERLSMDFAEVVGVDLSEPMLAQARIRYATFSAVQFHKGDFRGFHLNHQFDAAICAFNSLNYLKDEGELRQVFDAVAKHLRPGGLFVFDTMTEHGMFCLSGCYAHFPVGNSRIAMRCDYDLENRRETVKVILPTGVEFHRRIPIGAEDVLAAANGSELEVIDYFSHAWIPDRWRMGMSCFAVLRKR